MPAGTAAPRVPQGRPADLALDRARLKGSQASPKGLRHGSGVQAVAAGLLGVMWLADRGPQAAAGRGQFSDVRRLPVGVGEDAGDLDQVHPPLSGPI